MVFRWHTLIIHRLGCIHVHYVAKVWHIWASNSSCSATLRVAWRIIVVALVVAWMVRVIRWHHTTMSLVSGGVLLRHILVIISRWCVLVWVVAWHVSIFARLWTDSMKSAQSWTLFIVTIMSITIHITCVAYRSSCMIDISIWTQELISVAIFTNRRMAMIMNLDVRLPELVQDWSGSFCIDSRYLSHNLSIIRAIVILTSTLNLLVRANLWWTIFVSVTIWSKVLTLARLVWRSIIGIESRALLVVDHSIFLQTSGEIVHSISITCV